MKVGGGAPPILAPEGWLALYHGVEAQGVVGTYRTFWALHKTLSEPAGYFPYVQSCNNAWIPVVPQSVPAG